MLSCYPDTVHSGSQPGKRNPIDKALNSSEYKPQIRARPRATWQGCAVEAHRRVSGPSTGRNSGRRRIKKSEIVSRKANNGSEFNCESYDFKKNVQMFLIYRQILVLKSG